MVVESVVHDDLVGQGFDQLRQAVVRSSSPLRIWSSRSRGDVPRASADRGVESRSSPVVSPARSK